jgi:hypothetical protein
MYATLQLHDGKPGQLLHNRSGQPLHNRSGQPLHNSNVRGVLATGGGEARGSTRQLHAELSLAHGCIAVGQRLALHAGSQMATVHVESILGVVTLDERQRRVFATTLDGAPIQRVQGRALAIVCLVPLSPINVVVGDRGGRILISAQHSSAYVQHAALTAVGRVVSHVDWSDGLRTDMSLINLLASRSGYKLHKYAAYYDVNSLVAIARYDSNTAM